MYLQGITRTTEQRHQLIKRMEPLAEENEKLKAAMILMEKNIQSAQRERDLAESNARDLEHQKGVPSEQLVAAFEQLRCKSQELASASMQLEQKSKQLRNVSEQKACLVYRRMCFVLLNSHIFGDDCCACRAKHRAQAAVLGPQTTPRGEGEGDMASK